jgi:hypothetical protein
MSSFVHCRGCGVQIHETAPTCPKCGAPQNLVAAPGATAAGTSTAAARSAYSQVPWFRRRWFLIVSLLTIAPIAGAVALTGGMYYDARGGVKMFQKNIKTGVIVISLYYLYTLTTPIGSTQQLICFLLSAAVSVLMGVKR